MKIIKLEAQNVKRLQAIEISPAGDVVEIRGANGAGKTSVLDAIWMAIGGKSASPEQPIRQGKTSASATVNLGALVIRRTWTKTNTYLAVTTREGHQYKSPQKVLDELVGKLTFDPLEFTRMSVAERRTALLDLLGIEDTLLELDRQEQSAFNARREAKHKASDHRATADSIHIPDDTPQEAVDIGALSQELQAAFGKKRENDLFRERLREYEADAARARNGCEDLVSQIHATESTLNQLRQAHEEATRACGAAVKQYQTRCQQVDKLVDPDIAPIEGRLQSAQSVNASVAKRNEADTHAAKAVEWAQRGTKHGEAVEQIRSKRQQLLRNAKWPVEGVTIEGDSVCFNGIPFDQCSASEQLRVSLNIAMAMNPKLRVLLVRDGSLLDDASLKLMYDEVKAADFQLWIERVGEDRGTGEAGVLIEDGHIRIAGD